MEEEGDSSQHICCVCGDTATGYRFYGARSVCSSCRIFFRRIVTSGQRLSCIDTGSRPCILDKTTRNHCKQCRYDKCLAVGLLPHLVNTANRKQRVVNQKTKDLAILPLQNTTHVRLELSTSSLSSPLESLKLEDQFESGTIFGNLS